MAEKWILGIYLPNREQEASRVQYILTKFGCVIKTRFGINADDDNGTSGRGLILLELIGDPSEFRKLKAELHTIGSIQVEQMVFAG
ncbi:MAG: hypothetical protein D4R67_08100 [Bacteroidetes bacterium]|nr:MAG: hypothetical protein D4R67_08100 [Bacteroidota bacterium]